jgi:hypothetical protein
LGQTAGEKLRTNLTGAEGRNIGGQKDEPEKSLAVAEAADLGLDMDASGAIGSAGLPEATVQ